MYVFILDKTEVTLAYDLEYSGSSQERTPSIQMGKMCPRQELAAYRNVEIQNL